MILLFYATAVVYKEIRLEYSFTCGVGSLDLFSGLSHEIGWLRQYMFVCVNVSFSFSVFILRLMFHLCWIVP